MQAATEDVLADSHPGIKPTLMEIDVDYVRARLEEAMDTMTLMKASRHTWPEGFGSAWPEMLTNFWEMWNSLEDFEKEERRRELNREYDILNKDGGLRRLTATPEEISRMDEVLPDWLLYIKDPRNRRAVMAIAAGKSYRATARYDGRSHEWIRQTYLSCLERIAWALKKNLTLRPF